MLDSEGCALLQQDTFPVADGEPNSMGRKRCVVREVGAKVYVRLTVSRRPAEDNEYIDASNVWMHQHISKYKKLVYRQT